MEENIQSVTRHYTNPGRQRNKRRVREASIQEGRKKCSVNRLTRFKCLVSDSSAAGTQHQAPGDASPRHQRSLLQVGKVWMGGTSWNLYCCLSTLTPPDSPLLFIKISPPKFEMLTPSMTCLSIQSLWTPVTIIEYLTSAPLWWWFECNLRTDLFSLAASLLVRCSLPLV